MSVEYSVINVYLCTHVYTGADPKPEVGGGLLILNRGDISKYTSQKARKGSITGFFFKSRCSQRVSPITILNHIQKNVWSWHWMLVRRKFLTNNYIFARCRGSWTPLQRLRGSSDPWDPPLDPLQVNDFSKMYTNKLLFIFSAIFLHGIARWRYCACQRSYALGNTNRIDQLVWTVLLHFMFLYYSDFHTLA